MPFSGVDTRPNQLPIYRTSSTVLVLLPTQSGNYVQISAATTGNNPQFTPLGVDSNIGLDFITKGGSGTFNFKVAASLGTATVLTLSSAGAANNNGFTLKGTGTGAAPSINVTGTDSVISLSLIAKSTGNFDFFNGSIGTNRHFQVNGGVAAVNYLSVAGTTTGNALPITANGTDTNISIQLTPKGTGTVTGIPTPVGSTDAANKAYVDATKAVAINAAFLSPANGTYILMLSAPIGGTINSLTIGTDTGTCTVAIQIGTTNVTGLSAVSVTSTPGTTNATAANTFSTGNKIQIVVSSVASSPTQLNLSLNITTS